MKRAATAVLTVVGLTLVLVAVMVGVLLGPRGEWRAEGRVAQGAPAVVVQPALAAVTIATMPRSRSFWRSAGKLGSNPTLPARARTASPCREASVSK
jgi:hypothetical protein